MKSAFKYIAPPEMVVRSTVEDPYEKRVNNWLTPWDGEEFIDAGLLGIPFSKADPWGSNASSLAPNAIRQAFLINTTYSPDFDVDVQTLRVRDLGDVLTHAIDVAQSHANIEAAAVEFYQRFKHVPLIGIGGDHSITRPLIQGYASTHPGQQIGIIHFDAHNDVRSFEVGGPTNGTPFRGLLEHSPAVSGKNLVQVGIHGFMNSSVYKEYCHQQGVTVISARRVRQRGIQAVMDEAIAIASEGTDVIYVSVDIDVLALPFALGTGAATPEGMAAWDVLEALFLLGQHPKVCGLDVVEIDPLRDFGETTARMGSSIILTFLGGFSQRQGDRARWKELLTSHSSNG
ncbi:MAG: formimidoylglutamase [Synechococcales cyanobacterium]